MPPASHIIDDPLRPRGLRSRPFDAEGIAGRKRHLVEDGVLKTWILDCATARELELETTGHAQRGVSSTPSPGPSNLHMTPGDKSPDELIADIDDGFYVTDMIGMGVNLVTGDYSRGASGFWIENGERTYPVSEVTIAGHLSDMFASLVPANDLVFRYGTNAPTLRVEGYDRCRPMRAVDPAAGSGTIGGQRTRGRRSSRCRCSAARSAIGLKLESSPVSDADIAVDRLLHERLASESFRHRLAVRGKRRRSVPP